MHSSSDVSLIVFALLAVFVIWRLRSVLGTRTGHERPPYNPFDKSGRKADIPEAHSDEASVARLPGSIPFNPISKPESGAPSEDRWRGYAEPGSPTWAGLNAIASIDPSFDAKSFLDGARAAYEAVIMAFSKGDRATLRQLLADEVFDAFDGAIRSREQRNEKKETIIVALEAKSIDSAHVANEVAHITVRFAAKLIAFTKDQTGAVVEGSVEKVVDHVDLWTFARLVTSPDPNWKLEATEPVT